MEKIQLEALAKRLNLINYNSEPEKYILTIEDEKKVIEYEIEQKKKWRIWKLSQMSLPEQDILIRIDKIDWMKEIDREDVLQRANSMKHHDIWQKEQREKEKNDLVEKANEIRERHTANYIYNLIAWTSLNVYGKKLILNDLNKSYIKAICYFFSNDIRFETELNFSFKKGLMIRGISGLGKTYIPKCIENNELKPLSIFSMIDISEEIKNSGGYDLQTARLTYLDDVGTEEPTINYFGTKINWFKNFIEMYYLQNRPFERLIISTNCNGQQLEDKYGFRVRSRTREMFNVIDVQGNDMRI